MFDLNLATLPNSILYLEGMQLSYVKVYVHIFNLWHSHNPCFISNAEFAKRTGLHPDTVRTAIQFFENNSILKRVQKNGKRYLIQVTKFIETNDEEPVDNSEKTCTNIGRGAELDPPPCGVRPPLGAELDPHNNKLNTKSKKSFCASLEIQRPKLVDNRKIENEKKHDFANKKDDVTCNVKFWGPGHPSWDSLNPEKRKTP